MFMTSKWITAPEIQEDIVPTFKKEFICQKVIEHATLYITALGVYEAFINQSRVGEFVLAPGWTAYEHRIQYQAYDVTSMLQEKNTLCVTVARGWFSSPFGGSREAMKEELARPKALLAKLCITYCDGTEETLNTDETWEYSESSIRFCEIYDGETYDASFCPQQWFPAKELDYSYDILIPQEGEEVRELERVSAKQILITPDGDVLVDFGQNITGYVEFSVSAHQGEVVRILHAEVLDKDGNFYNLNYRSAKAEINYICREGENTYHPHLTFFGFRYIKLAQWPQTVCDIKPEQFCGIAVSSNLRKTGTLRSSNSILNQFFSNVLWGQKGNFLDVPTDCPQRDERLGWTGDAQVFCKAASYNYDVNRFFKKWLKDLYYAQMDTDGAVPYVVPNVLWKGRRLGSAAWGDAATVIPWQIYMTYDDVEVLEDQWDSMVQWIGFIGGNTKTPYLWVGGKHFGDWLALDGPEGQYKGISNDDFIASAFYAYSVSLVIQTGKVLKKDVTEYEKLYHGIVTKFRETFPECKTQTECALALYFELAEDPEKTAQTLVSLIKKAGRMETGFVGTPYILHALSEHGYSELAYELLLREEYPSWLFSVNQGATTVWEHWDGIKENGEFWSENMNSFNHYAYGSVVDWVYEKAAGIRPVKPGFAEVIIAPSPTRKLEWLEASILTVNGYVSSKWTHTQGGIRYDITLPVAGKVIIDGIEKIVPAGQYVFWGADAE